MTKVTVVREPAGPDRPLGGKSGGRVRRIRVEGHAGFGRRGKDIVCAAISVTAYTAAGAIAELAGAADCYVEREAFFEVGLWDAQLLQDADRMRTAEVIMETACVGYRQIAAAYPGHIRLLETEG
jgi:uncharacterized protein YsxB (DUF464 family)